MVNWIGEESLITRRKNYNISDDVGVVLNRKKQRHAYTDSKYMTNVEANSEELQKTLPKIKFLYILVCSIGRRKFSRKILIYRRLKMVVNSISENLAVWLLWRIPDDLCCRQRNIREGHVRRRPWS